MKDPANEPLGTLARDLDAAEEAGHISRTGRNRIAAGLSIGGALLTAGLLGHLTPKILESMGLESKVPHGLYDYIGIAGACIAWFAAAYFLNKIRSGGK